MPLSECTDGQLDWIQSNLKLVRDIESIVQCYMLKVFGVMRPTLCITCGSLQLAPCPIDGTLGQLHSVGRMDKANDMDDESENKDVHHPQRMTPNHNHVGRRRRSCFCCRDKNGIQIDSCNARQTSISSSEFFNTMSEETATLSDYTSRLERSLCFRVKSTIHDTIIAKSRHLLSDGIEEFATRD
eukprot:Gb_00427 [translate_table: standard]